MDVDLSHYLVLVECRRGTGADGSTEEAWTRGVEALSTDNLTAPDSNQCIPFFSSRISSRATLIPYQSHQSLVLVVHSTHLDMKPS